MAKTGVSKLYFGKWDKTKNEYTECRWLAHVAGINFQPTKSEGEDYGDNMVVDSESIVVGGNITLELNEDDEQIYIWLLGHTQSVSGEITESNIDDEPGEFGTGFVGKSGRKWKGKVYHRFKYSEPDDENETRKESTTFGHLTLEGKMIIPENKTWREVKVFDTEAAAETWIKEQLGFNA